ncbi:MAG: hypothetical protein ACOVQN_04275 [Exiguobacterium sp.]
MAFAFPPFPATAAHTMVSVRWEFAMNKTLVAMAHPSQTIQVASAVKKTNARLSPLVVPEYALHITPTN